MRALPLLLLALPAFADPKPAPPPEARGKAVKSELKVNVSGCASDEDAQRLASAVRSAAEMVDSCMAKQNPGIAKRIHERFPKYRFHCADGGGLAGGDTTFDGPWTDLTMSFHPRGQQYPFVARVFHEMIHGSDPKHALVLSAKTHAQAGYPDPVYACQFACYPDEVGNDEAKQVGHLEAALNEEKKHVPLAEGVDCPQGADCPSVAAFTGICRGGKVLSTAAIRDGDKERNYPKCFAEALMNACDAGCKKRKSPVCERSCAFADAPNDAKGDMIPGFMRLGKRLQDGKDLAADETALKHDAEKRKAFQACR